MFDKRLGIICALVLSSCNRTAEGTVALPGDEKAFDVIANFDKIAAHAGQDAKLVEMEAWYVQTNGLMDLTQEYRPRVDFQFAAKATQADVDGQGARAPGSGFSVGALIDVEVDIRAPYTASVSTAGKKYLENHLGMDRDPSSEASAGNRYVAPPKCSFAQLWKDAIAKGAPTDVVAIIRYHESGYEFEANGREFKVYFDMNCKVKEPSNGMPSTNPN